MSSDLGPTRAGLHQLATHVLARRRAAVTGRFGLRPTPGGLGTPAFGSDELEVVRTSGRFLVLERGDTVVAEPITTLAAAAELVGVDLDAPFSVGDDTPRPVAPDAVLAVDDADARTLADWWAFGRTVLDEIVATDAELSAATVPQVWPEHFDLGCTVERHGQHLNVGASPGDAHSPSPYLYVGPWSDERPGAAHYWNAPFGAVLRVSDIDHLDPRERRTRALAFLAGGLRRF